MGSSDLKKNYPCTHCNQFQIKSIQQLPMVRTQRAKGKSLLAVEGCTTKVCCCTCIWSIVQFVTSTNDVLFMTIVVEHAMKCASKLKKLSVHYWLQTYLLLKPKWLSLYWNYVCRHETNIDGNFMCVKCLLFGSASVASLILLLLWNFVTACSSMLNVAYWNFMESTNSAEKQFIKRKCR